MPYDMGRQVCQHGHFYPCSSCDRNEIEALRARVAEAEAKQKIDQQQCDDMTSEAARLAEENTALRAKVEAWEPAVALLVNCWHHQRLLVDDAAEVVADLRSKGLLP